MRVEDKGFWFQFEYGDSDPKSVTIGTPYEGSITVPMSVIRHIWMLV